MIGTVFRGVTHVHRRYTSRIRILLPEECLLGGCLLVPTKRSLVGIDTEAEIGRRQAMEGFCSGL